MKHYTKCRFFQHTELINIILNESIETEYSTENADLNQDDIIDILDIVSLVNTILDN